MPDDGMMNRLTAGLVPNDCRFALIADANGGDVTGLFDDIAGDFELGMPDFSGVMFHPAGLGINLRELLLGTADGIAFMVEEDRPRGSGALVKREDAVCRHCRIPFNLFSWRSIRAAVHIAINPSPSPVSPPASPQVGSRSRAPSISCGG